MPQLEAELRSLKQKNTKALVQFAIGPRDSASFSIIAIARFKQNSVQNLNKKIDLFWFAKSVFLFCIA